MDVNDQDAKILSGCQPKFRLVLVSMDHELRLEMQTNWSEAVCRVRQTLHL